MVLFSLVTKITNQLELMFFMMSSSSIRYGLLSGLPTDGAGAGLFSANGMLCMSIIMSLANARRPIQRNNWAIHLLNQVLRARSYGFIRRFKKASPQSKCGMALPETIHPTQLSMQTTMRSSAFMQGAMFSHADMGNWISAFRTQQN